MLGANLQTVPPGVDGRAALENVRKRVFGPDGPAPGSAEAGLPYLRSEHMLVRFLIARQWDVEKAVAMLRDHYRWLAETKMSKLLQDPFPEEQHIKKYYPQAYHGTDKKGRPIYIERPGCIDMPRLLQVTTPERLLDYIYAGSELQIRRRLPACSLVRGEVVDKSLNIMDLDGLGFRVVTHNTARRVLRDVVTVLQNHYPECSGRLVIVNAPKVFGIAWSFVKPMLDEKTVAKISIYGTDREAYSKALLELVDADQLPALFGGTCVCDGKDKLSCMRSIKGPWADPEILRLLEAEPLERIMTPEGCKLLQRQRFERAPAPAGASAEQLAAKAPAEPEAPAAQAGETIAAEEEEEERDSFAMGTPGPILHAGLQRSRSAMLVPEVAEAETDVARLLEEYSRAEEAHMKTLTEWVEQFNGLVRDIGRHVIERAQGYYDSRALWQQVVQEYARQQEEVDLISGELERAVKNLARAEAAFEKFVAGEEGLPEEEWAELVQIKASDLPTEAAASDKKLLRTLRVSALADCVTSLQWQRDAAMAELSSKSQELADVRRRFELEDQQHSGCTWNCSVKRAAPFYEKRRMHEAAVDAQLATLRDVERRLQDARRRMAALMQGNDPSCVLSTRSRQLDEMSLQSFEIAGGQPAQDEFLSCTSGSDHDGD